MGRKRHSPEEIIGKLREAEVLIARGSTTPQAAKAIGVTEQTYYRWRREYGGMKVDQAKRLKHLERENQRLRKAVSDLTLDKMILEEVGRGMLAAPRAEGSRSTTSGTSSACPSGGRAGWSGSIGPPSARCREAVTTRRR